MEARSTPWGDHLDALGIRLGLEPLCAILEVESMV
jgi:hypothetical protein